MSNRSGRAEDIAQTIVDGATGHVTSGNSTDRHRLTSDADRFVIF